MENVKATPPTGATSDLTPADASTPMVTETQAPRQRPAVSEPRDGTDARPPLHEPDSARTAGAAQMDAALAPSQAGPLPVRLTDPALARAFARAPAVRLRAGDSGERVVALQYACARLGLWATRIDDQFTPDLAEAVRAFQRSPAGRRAGLAATGELDRRTLLALDAEVSRLVTLTPAAQAASPLDFLSDFDRLGLPRITLADSDEPYGWAHPEIQAAYGRFVADYWPVLKEQRVELDCKGLAVLFMWQFRLKLRADCGVELPLPGHGAGRLPEGAWMVVSPEQPGEFFRRTDELAEVRPGYDAVARVEALDPSHSMLRGPNLSYRGVAAHQVFRAATPVAGQDTALDNLGDETAPEVSLELAQPGDIIFIDHRDEGRTFDHTVNVIEVERDEAGRVRRLVLAVASFDDMKDATSATAPRGLWEVNQYVEEVVVELDAAGTISRSEVTYSSEPSYLVAPRYGATRTVMELQPGGVLRLCRWG